MTDKYVLVTSGSTTTLPSDFSSTNTIHLIGAGAGGANGASAVLSGAGGGGGAYANISNIANAASSTVHIQVGAGDTWLRIDGGSTAPTTTAQGVLAKAASGTTGGASGSCVGTVKNSGGNGGAATTCLCSAGAGGGGGGAGGLNGAGNPGISGPCGAGGGSGDAGSGGAGGSFNTDGSPGAEWTITAGGTAGSGGGGGGGATANGGNGGNYGAGGGGGGDSSCFTGGLGTQGIIIIQYTPAVGAAAPAWGFEQIWQPPSIQARSLRNVHSTIYAQGDQGTQAQLIRWFNQGWPVQYWDIKHPKYRSPDIGDRGNQAVYIPTIAPQIAEFGHDPTWADLRHIFKHSPETGDSGGPQFVQWFNAGWEIQPPQPPAYPLARQKYVGTKGRIELPIYPLWTNMGWEVQYRDIKHSKFNSPDIGDQGINARLNQWYNAGWPVQYWDVRHPKYNSPDVGDTEGIQSPYTLWKNTGWEIQYRDIKHPIYKNPDIGDRGTQAVYIPTIAPQIIESGHDPIWADLRHIFRHSPETGDYPVAPLIQWFNTGWEVRPPEVIRQQSYRYAGIQFRSGFLGSNFLPYGWEVLPWQPPHRRFKNLDDGDKGNQAAYSFVPPGRPEFGHDPTWADLRHIFKHSPETGDQGTEAQFINWFSAGWEIQPYQPPHTFKEKRWGATVLKDDGIQTPLINWFNQGWEIQPPPPPHTFKEKRWGATVLKDDGIQTPLINWFNAGWPVQYWDIKHPKYNSPGVGDSGTEAAFIFAPPLSRGWHVQYWDIKHPKFRNPDVNSSGIEAAFVFVPPTPLALGNWAYQQITCEFPFRFKKNPEIGDQGTQARLINWFNAGWAVQYRDIKHPKFNSPDTGDQGIESVYVYVPIPLNWGQEQQSGWQPPRWQLSRLWGALSQWEDGIESPYVFVFVPPPPPTPFDMSTWRMNGFSINADGSLTIWWINTATGLTPVDEDGNPVNPF